MSQTTLPEPQTDVEPIEQGRHRFGRWPVVLALVIGMIFSAVTQNWASSWKEHNAGAQPIVAQRGALSTMDSYALALMLGGLRGPLVMVLWSQVEGQKISKDLEDLDTMIEWIRLLQPEFDTVHIFQIWNKAYNISVMMASTASKYQTIMDAVDYARKVDRDRPGDLNILDSLARVCADKLGGKNVAEAAFYRVQFRQDTLTDANRLRAYPKDKSYRRMGLKFLGPQNGPILDDHNDIVAPLLQPTVQRPADLPANSQWNDGSELQYLAKYQPFPYGISPSALGFNYAKRAQVAMTVGGQRAIQVSETVIDSRPGLLLKQWAQEEADRAVVAEAQAYGIASDAQPTALELTTAPITADSKLLDTAALESARYSYSLSAVICQDALKEYRRHLANPQYVNPYQTYLSHLDELGALHALAAADAAYTDALLAKGDRTRQFAQAVAAYQDARARYERMLLKYAMESEVATPLYLDPHVDLGKLTPDDLNQLYLRAMNALPGVPPAQREYEEQRQEYIPYISRADTRMRLLSAYNTPSLLEIH